MIVGGNIDGLPHHDHGGALETSKGNLPLAMDWGWFWSRSFFRSTPRHGHAGLVGTAGG